MSERKWAPPFLPTHESYYSTTTWETDSLQVQLHMFFHHILIKASHLSIICAFESVVCFSHSDATLSPLLGICTVKLSSPWWVASSLPAVLKHYLCSSGRIPFALLYDYRLLLYAWHLSCTGLLHINVLLVTSLSCWSAKQYDDMLSCTSEHKQIERESEKIMGR